MSSPNFAVFDIDGTQFKSSCVEKAIEVAIQRGVFSAEAFEATYAKRRLWQIDNNEGVYQSYLHHLVGAFVTSIAGVEVKQFQSVIDQMVRQQRVRLFSYTRQLAQILNPSHKQVAISGSPQIIVEPFLEGLGFDQIIGSQFEIEDGYFTGRATSVDKQQVLTNVVGNDGSLSVAIGDTVGDLPVLEQASCPIAFNPSATLRRTAISQRWPIVYEQKDAITQLLPMWDGYTAVFDRSPSVVLDFAGVQI